jgi:hypothetical protein
MKLRRLPTPALVLAGLLILLGHDVLMAGNPHAQETSHTVVHEEPETDCHGQGGARPVSHNPSDPHVARSAVHELSRDSAPPEPLCVWDVEPGHPPGTIRAFLQVFLN